MPLANAAAVRQRSLTKLRAKNYDGSKDEWAAIISFVLRSREGPVINNAQKANLDVTCSISGKDPNGTLTIAIRHKVEDITQNLGNIELPQTEDTDDIDLFGWTLQAIEKRDKLDGMVEAQTGELQSKDAALKTLQKQIDELVEAKAEHEKQLLSNFTVLLNEKKLKIRTMHRVLSTAKTDPKTLKELQSVLKEEESATPRRRKKRHATEPPKDDETEESEAFETMEVDQVSNVRQHTDREGDSASSRETTPAPSETDEDEDNDLGGSKQTESRPRTRAMDSKGKGSKQKSPSPLPPRRELPFQRTGRQHNKAPTTQKEQKSQPAPPPGDDDEETASEDDEL